MRCALYFFGKWFILPSLMTLFWVINFKLKKNSIKDERNSSPVLIEYRQAKCKYTTAYHRVITHRHEVTGKEKLKKK